MRCKALTIPLLVACLMAGSCTSKPEYSDEQKRVLAATQVWVNAVQEEDLAAMWQLLSRSAQLFYEIELTAPKGMRGKVARLKAGIAEGSLISADERKSIEEELAKCPEDPDKMTPEQYYAWYLRFRDGFTPGRKQATAKLLAESNIRELVVSQGKATIILAHGEPSKCVWVLEENEWKYDLKPAMSRLLERSVEGRGRGD